MPVRTAAAALVALGLAGVLSTGVPAAQIRPLRERVTRGAVDALGAGKLLVAARRLPDPNFANTVILLTDVTGDGAVGLVLNRPSKVPLGKVFPHLVPNMATTAHAFLGGPVDATRPMALLRASPAPAGSRHVVDGVHVATARDPVDAAVVAGSTSSRLRIYLGYAGWGAGQLQAETAQGAWHVLEGAGDIVFDAEPASLWQRQIARTELIQARGVGPSTGLCPATSGGDIGSRRCDPWLRPTRFAARRAAPPIAWARPSSRRGRRPCAGAARRRCRRPQGR
jgi:putative transcriptional regulator